MLDASFAINMLTENTRINEYRNEGTTYLQHTEMCGCFQRGWDDY